MSEGLLAPWWWLGEWGRDWAVIHLLLGGFAMPVQQRVLVVALIAAIVGGLILLGCSPQLAVTVVSGIVLVAREVWAQGPRRDDRHRLQPPVEGHKPDDGGSDQSG